MLKQVQHDSTLISFLQNFLKKMYRPSTQIKRTHKGWLFLLWGGWWDCLGFFALNVSSCFACVIYITLQKHSALCKNPLELHKMLTHFSSFSPSHTQIKKVLTKAKTFFMGQAMG